MEKTNLSSNKFIDSILIAKGIGIILVVIGHYFPDNSPLYWSTLHKIIYSFHMPLFFLLSGYLFHNLENKSYLKHVKMKISRLLIPFLSIAVLFFIIKLLTGYFFHLEFPVNINSLIHIFINPLSSYMPLLWFIYTLFIIFLVYPLLIKLMKRTEIVFIFSILLIFIPTTEWFCIGEAVKNLPFFSFGVLLSYLLDLNKKIQLPAVLLSILILSVLFLISFYLYIELNVKYLKLLNGIFIGITGSMIIILISVLINMSCENIIKNVLVKAGYYSMSIYLLHTLFESSVRIFAYQFMGFNNIFEIIAAVSIISGIVFPLLLEKYILRNFKFTQKFFLGISVK